jgi:hypothetical protein
MVSHRFGNQGQTGHKTKGFDKGFKLKLTVQFSLNNCPSIEGGKGDRYFVGEQGLELIHQYLIFFP